MDIYYGTAAAAREAAQLWLFVEGSTKAPARAFDLALGYHYRVKANNTVARFFFSPNDGTTKRAPGRR